MGKSGPKPIVEPGEFCLVKDCQRAPLRRGWCKTHYERWRVHGDPLIKMKPGPRHPRVKPGEVFGRLTAIKDTGERRHRAVVWLCRCECGAETKVRVTSLRNGKTRSCGCLQRDVAARRTPADRKRRIAESVRRSRFKKYGLSLEEADAMLALGCALCGTHDDLCIDHNHMNGKARAALCRKCNSMLGLAKDDPMRLRRAAEYLEKHSEILKGTVH